MHDFATEILYNGYKKKSYAIAYALFISLAGAGGIEPPRNGVKVRCLTTWLYPQNCKKKWGEWWGSNPRITEPQSAVLASSPHPPHQASYKVIYMTNIMLSRSIFFVKCILLKRLPPTGLSAKRYGLSVLQWKVLKVLRTACRIYCSR